MARVPYEPVSQVGAGPPSGQLENIQASPADFGALSGQATEKLGGTIEQSGDAIAQNALRIQALNNESASRDQLTKYTPGAGQLWANYSTLQGKAAVDAYPGFVSSLQKLQQDHAAALASPQARNDFLNASSYILNRLTLMSSTHAAEQQQQYWKQSHAANVDNMTQTGVLFQNDPQTIDVAANSVAGSVEQLGKMNGWDPEETQRQTQAAVGKYYHTVMTSMVASDPVGGPAKAQALFDRVQPKMDATSIVQSQVLLKSSVDRANVADAANTVISGGTSTSAAAPVAGGRATDATWQRMIAMESGGHQFGPDGQPLTSSAGAVGLAQVEPDTGREVAQKHGFDYDPEALKTDSGYNHMLGRAYFGDLVKQYGGNLTLASAAYNAGPKRVDQWVAQNGDPRTGSISDADWAAKIPINETRAYVARVAQPSSAPAKTGGPVPAGPLAIGDSLAGGISAAGGIAGPTKVGANPQDVLQTITQMPPDQVSGRDVILSGGASNDPSKAALVEQQVSALQQKGAHSVTIVGVGDRQDFAAADVNGQLAAIAAKTGARFVPLDPASLSADRVHPANYTPLISQTAPTGSAAPASGAPPPPGTSTHSPEAFTVEQKMVNDAWTEAQQRFPGRPDLQRQVVSLVYEHLSQANVLQQKYETEVAKQQRDAQEGAGQSVIKQLMTDPSKFDPAMIRDNPALTWEQKEHLWNMARTHMATGVDDRDVKTYGSGFYSLFQQIHAPQGDPSRITDPSQLWGHVGPNGDLTVSGVDKLTAEIQARRSPEGESESEMRKQFLANARGQITGTNEGLHLRDPKGDELFLKFMAQSLPAYDAGRKQGLSAAQLLDPSSKDYIGASIGTFKRPMTVWVKDMMDQNTPGDATAAAPAGAASAVDLNSRDGIIAAYHSGRINRADAGAALVSKGFAVAPPPPAAAAPKPSLVPTN